METNYLLPVLEGPALGSHMQWEPSIICRLLKSLGLFLGKEFNNIKRHRDGAGRPAESRSRRTGNKQLHHVT
jgi:hypothetical protein